MNGWRLLPRQAKISLALAAYLVVILAFLVLARRSGFDFTLEGLQALFAGQPPTPAAAQALPAALEVTRTATATYSPAVAWLRAQNNTAILGEPSQDAASVALLQVDQTARVMGVSANGKYWAIQAPYIKSGVGWVAAADVEIQNAAQAPVLVQGPGGVLPTEQMPLVEAVTNLNVRRNPDLNSVRLSVLKTGETAPAVGVSEDGDWYALKLPDGRTGWVAKDYVTVRNVENIPVMTVAPAALGTLIPSPQAGKASLTAAWTVNLRAGPGREYQVVGQLEQGMSAQIVGVSADGKWWAIAFAGQESQRAWVAADYVQAINTEGAPVLK
jgi:uncharacterized protein YraI